MRNSSTAEKYIKEHLKENLNGYQCPDNKKKIIIPHKILNIGDIVFNFMFETTIRIHINISKIPDESIDDVRKFIKDIPQYLYFTNISSDNILEIYIFFVIEDDNINIMNDVINYLSALILESQQLYPKIMKIIKSRG